MKKLTAKVGEYTDQQGNTKGRYVNVGVMGSNANGDYLLLDPSVNIAGVLVLQNAMAMSKGKAPSDRVMCGVWEEDNNQQQGGYQQQAPQQQYQQAPQQQPQQQYQPPQSGNFQNGAGYNGQ